MPIPTGWIVATAEIPDSDLTLRTEPGNRRPAVLTVSVQAPYPDLHEERVSIDEFVAVTKERRSQGDADHKVIEIKVRSAG